MNNNNRKTEREKSFIIASIEEEKQVYLTDISETGCQLFCDSIDCNEIKKGVNVKLSIEIPEFEAGLICNNTYLNGEIKWIKKNDDGSFASGIYFKYDKSTSKKQINKILYYWKFLNTTFGNDIK